MIKIANNLQKLANADITGRLIPSMAPFLNRMTPFVNHSDDPYSPAFAPAGSNPMSMSPERLYAMAENYSKMKNENPMFTPADHFSPQEMAMFTNTGVGLYNDAANSGEQNRRLYMYGTDGPAGFANNNGLRRQMPNLNQDYYQPTIQTDAISRSAADAYADRLNYANYLKDLNTANQNMMPWQTGSTHPRSFGDVQKFNPRTYIFR
jgi:hypothetical protein